MTTVRTVLWLVFRVSRSALTAVGVVALVFLAMLAVPLADVPELPSISQTVRTVDRSDMPGVDRFQARDGTTLGYRHYSPHQPAAPHLAVLVHGSSGSSASVHALARALAAAGVETFAPDIRGHGASGTRGDIGHAGQLEDDMADLLGEIAARARPGVPVTLLGHSSGGGFALRVAAAPVGKRFERVVMIAPYLGWDAPTSRPDSGGWARADVPRFIALAFLDKLGFHGADALPTLAFAVPEDSAARQTARYSYRLMRNFATGDFRADVAEAKAPLQLFSGSDDELMFTDRYQAALGATVPVDVIAGVNHMGVVSAPAAVATIAGDVAAWRGAAVSANSR